MTTTAWVARALQLPLRLIVRLGGGRHRLERIEMIPLEVPIARAIQLYGDPLESEVDEEFEEATVHDFGVGPFHSATITEWNGLVHEVTYWSMKADPRRDLEAVFNFYGNGHEWDVLTEGYAYLRRDGTRHIWCSAMPAIGVGTKKYRDAQLEKKGQD